MDRALLLENADKTTHLSTASLCLEEQIGQFGRGFQGVLPI